MATDRNATNRGGRSPGEIRLTTLTLADLNRIVAIENACYSFPWSPDSFHQVLEDPKTFGTLAARGRNGLVGYIVFSEVVDELHILNVAIDPSARQLGVATMMLIHLHQAALKRNRKFAFLEVRESNKAAQKLYEKFGYKRLGVRKDYYSDNHEDAIVMMSELKK